MIARIVERIVIPGLVALGFSSAAFAEAGVGLVTESSDGVSPRPQNLSELMEGETFTLGINSRLVYIQYVKCLEITAVGGSITVHAANYEASKARVTATQLECPQVVVLESTTASLAGLTLRSGRSRLNLPTHPSMIVVGEAAASYQRATFTSPNGETTELKIKDRRLEIPESAPGLLANTTYKLILQGKAVPDQEATVSVTSDEKGPFAVLRIQ